MRVPGIFGRKGQAVVETALIMPIIIIILTGIIDFGLLFKNYLIINNASREAARSAAVGSTDTDIRSLIANVTATLDQAKILITITPSGTARKKGDEITVTIKYDNNLITPIVSSIIPNPLHLTTKTVMRME